MTDHEFETRQIHAGYEPDEHGALVPPISTSVTYAYDSPSTMMGEYRYARMSEPTRVVVDDLIADLEGGTYGRTFASGMGAINALYTAVLSAGDHVVAGQTLYAESHTLLTRIFSEFGVDVTFADTTDIDAVADAIRPETALVYFETPTNPLLSITDIAGVVEVAAEVGGGGAGGHGDGDRARGDDADDGPVVAVDNTFASPYLQRPLDLGVDVVVESLTKYVSGHSDVVAGATITNDPALDEELAFVQYNQGATPSPFASSLVARGAKTLASRMRTHCENASEIAEFLDDHSAVSHVHYPGLPSHPNHDVAAEQMRDFGGMVSLELDATLEETAAVISETEIFALAESLGGVESLIEQPATMTHQDLTAEELAGAGLSESLVRLSVGTEHVDDLIGDLESAIEAVLG